MKLDWMSNVYGYLNQNEKFNKGRKWVKSPSKVRTEGKICDVGLFLLYFDHFHTKLQPDNKTNEKNRN